MMNPLRRRRVLVVALVAAPTLAAAPLAAGTAEAAPATATVFVIQGVADSPMTLSVDGNAVSTAAPAKTIVGPLSLPAGAHTIKAQSPNGTTEVSASVTVGEGANVDAVVHRQVDPSKPPVITTFPNDLAAVAAGSGRLAVAHTAAVGPADVRVDQKVLFANIASGEALTVTAPAGDHTVDIVPAATSGPAVFGPTTLPVAETALTRVFAIGVAATGSMDAVVQVLPLQARGAGSAPSNVNAGDGGQAAALIADAQGSRPVTGAGVLGAVALAGGVLLLWGRRRSSARRPG